MGKYVYLEDEEIDNLRFILENWNCDSGEEEKIINSIEDKLSQKPKTLEEFGYEIVNEDGECDFENNYHEITYMNKQEDREAIIFETVGEEVYFESLCRDSNNRDTIDLKNKPIELFEEYKNV